LHYGGSVVTTGEFGTWTLIGAVQVAGGGYDIAWHDPSSGLYTVWSTDSNGNYLSNPIGVVAGSSTALEALETTFTQDLNNDGTIGIPKVVIQTDGTTALTEVGTNYFLNPTGGGSGPELHYGGSVVTTAEFGTWTPIGAVQVAGGGYDIAWHDPSSGLYTVWSTDSNGNYLSNPIGVIAGSSTALEALETTFTQDLNNDGTIGILKVVIQTDGTTALTEVGTNYFLNPTGGGSGPELHYGGPVVTAGEFGTWTPIGAVQVTGGYDIAWHDPSSGLYTVWSTDSNGNYLSNLIGAVAGNSTALESFETTFNQDLNNDGTIGIYVAPGTTLQVTSPLPSAVGAATIGAGATLELGTADSASITLSSSTGMLKLDSLTAFTGVIDNFTGNGSLSASDQIDLKGINFNSVHDSYSNGILTVTDGTNTTTLDFNGTYVLANFKFASDGDGGTIVYDPPVLTQLQAPGGVSPISGNNAANLFAGAGQDSFAFASDYGWEKFESTANNHASFVSVQAGLIGPHERTYGPASLAASAHDAMPGEPLTEAHFHAHLGDFHIV
jgi:putative lipoic acid-binding regulatory protein